MATQVSIDSVIKASLKGVLMAAKEYYNWTGWQGLTLAPEYVTTVNVARAIFGISGTTFLTLEGNAKEILCCAGATGKGPLSQDLRANGRFDIMLYWANGYPRAPIEIKSCVKQYKNISADVKRLDGTLHRGKDKSSFQFALMVFHVCETHDKTFTAKEKVEKKLINLKADIKNHIGERTNIKLESGKIQMHEGSSFWCPVCIMLKPKT